MDDMADARPNVAERERALQELSQQLSAGRLTMTEFDERTTLATHADTRVQLASLFTDLPGIMPAPPVTPDPPAPANPLPSLTVLAGAITVFSVVSAWAAGNWLWLLLIAAAPVAVMVWRARGVA